MKKRRTKTSPSGSAPPALPTQSPDASPSPDSAAPRNVRRWIVVGIVLLAVTVRVLTLMAWRDRPIPLEASQVMEQAGDLRVALDPDELEILAPGREGEKCREHVSRWFCGYRKPPLFSGLMALAVRASEYLVPYKEVVDDDSNHPIAAITDMQRMWRLQAAAYVLAFVAGLWVLRPAWLILRRCGNEAAALAGLAFIAVLPCAVEASARPLADTLFAGLFLYAAAMLLDGLLDRSFDAIVNSGLLIGVAFLTRAEAVLLLPIGVLLLAAGAIGKRLTWPWALGSAMAFLIAVVVLAGPYIKVVSENQKQLTIGRNAGNDYLREIGALNGLDAFLNRIHVLKSAEATPEQQQAAAEAAKVRVNQVAAHWPGYFARNLFDVASRMLGYAGMLFVVTGLFFCWRSVFRWGAWQVAMLIFLLLAAMLSIYRPNERLLLSPVLLLSPLMGLGVALLGAELASRSGRPGSLRATAWIAGMCVVAVLAATVVRVMAT